MRERETNFLEAGTTSSLVGDQYRTDTMRDVPTKDEWVDASVCAQTDPEAFFPEKGGSTRNAKQVCESCEVREKCLEYALENNERYGIWGGLSERERRALQKRRVEEARATVESLAL